ncbi:hypothetical protein UFOVP453_37 [uncultured Caudovirales phage]|uniref:N-terminal domain-containing protein n=1 Tax=uncultured Caudovirales phage TaxID=2100421 RepID=A0A6J5MCQ3_9CAUD|nr:hypothetical protein UFOVP453_37 [uncultured Caudovirales phage]
MSIVKNVEIIAHAMIEHNVTETAHTFATWKMNGRAVRKGEKATFAVPIWNHSTYTDANGNEKTRYYLKTAHFFTLSQTDEIQPDTRKKGARRV